MPVCLSFEDERIWAIRFASLVQYLDHRDESSTASREVVRELFRCLMDQDLDDLGISISVTAEIP